MQFVAGWTNFYIGGYIVLNMLVSMKGLEGFTFEECRRLASEADIEDLKVPFLHINQLITNKKAVNRGKDKIDVMELEKIIELRREMGLDP